MATGLRSNIHQALRPIAETMKRARMWEGGVARQNSLLTAYPISAELSVSLIMAQTGRQNVYMFCSTGSICAAAGKQSGSGDSSHLKMRMRNL
jgi:hypothetical protein